jgi:hypothetical protein
MSVRKERQAANAAAGAAELAPCQRRRGVKHIVKGAAIECSDDTSKKNNPDHAAPISIPIMKIKRDDSALKLDVRR